VTTREYAKADDRSGCGGAGLAVVPDKQVLEHLVEALVFVLGQRDIFEDGNVFSPSYSLQFAQDSGSVARQSLQLLAHGSGLVLARAILRWRVKSATVLRYLSVDKLFITSEVL
jgi:hypothetical protein